MTSDEKITVCIRNVDDAAWRYVKSEAAKRKMTIAEFFSVLMARYREETLELNKAPR